MSNEIRLEGLDDFLGFVDDMEITQEDETRAIRKAMNHIKRYVEPKAPKGDSGNTVKSIKVKVKKNSFSTEGIIYVSSWYAIFQNYRNTKQKGKYIGWFEKAIADSEKEALNIISNELMKNK